MASTNSANNAGVAGLANQACKRCYNRKKKCDRTLPQCRACQHARVQCSFEEQQEESGMFPIAYVRGLETRVKRLEQQLKFMSNPDAKKGSTSQPFGQIDSVADLTSKAESSNVDVKRQSLQSERSIASTSNAERRPSIPQTDPSDVLASELKLLSLEATAERYLGPSSGASFAKLTQAVLRRLRSDQYPFGYDDDKNKAYHAGQVVSPTLAVEDSVESKPIDEPLPAPFPMPGEEQAMRLTDYYWSHSHTLYPFVRKIWFMNCLKLMYSQPDHQAVQSHAWLYTMWMVFAIGSTSLASVLVIEESESNQYFNNAMVYFDGALSHGNVAALDAILLQISYSFFNRIGPNTWYLVGAATRIAIGMGLHAAPTSVVLQLPLDIQEYRKRLFHSLYMADRVVSVSLGRPFGIRDADVELELFTDAEDEDFAPDATLCQIRLTPSSMSVPLHIRRLRQIAGEIFEEVYTSRNRLLPPQARDEILQILHERLLEWRRNMPFPLPPSRTLRVPQLTTNWFDLNYYNHLLMLYRPSPLCPTITVEKVNLIAEASAMSIRQAEAMHRQQAFAFNWLNLFQVFTATLTLIYSVTAQPDTLSVYLQRSDALLDLELAIGLLETFGKKFPSALKCRNMVQDVERRLRAHLGPSDPAAGFVQPAVEIVPGRARSSTSGSHPDFPSLGQVKIDEAIAYPAFHTDPRFDELQHLVRGINETSPVASAGSLEGNHLTPSVSDSGLPYDLHFPATPNPFGAVTAQFIAAGLGQSSDMDLDADFMDFLGGNFDG